MRKTLAWLSCMLVAGAPSFAALNGTEYPHATTIGIGCDSCHWPVYSPTEPPAWTIFVPQNIDDTPLNVLCWHCHNDIVAPYVRTHSSVSTDARYGSWSMGCRTCHDPHQQAQKGSYGSASYLYQGSISFISGDSLRGAGGWTDNQFQGMVVTPNNIQWPGYGYKVLRNSSDTLYVSGPMDLGKAAAGNTFVLTYGKSVKSSLATPSSGRKAVKFFRETGANSFSDGDVTYDGICEVCHTATSHYRNNGSPDHSHNQGVRCTQCHLHKSGFRMGGGAHSAHDALFSCSAGNLGCHGANTPPMLSDGQNLQNTTLCNACHSPGGSYDGVNDPAIGGKANWEAGVYSGGNLRPGKEKWCAGCHDEGSSVVSGVSAPNVVGDEDAPYGYGTGWGFFKTGHGRPGGFYPASGAPAANLGCTACHDPGAPHIDGSPRTYSVSGDNYQAGYRLKRPMDVPRTDQGEPVADFQLCLDCHASSPLLVSTDMTTNFRSGTTTNEHWLHLQAPPTGQFAGGGWWDSDWDGTGDSKISCTACHNVHGSPSPRMLRHGELISTPGTTDKVPAINFRYTPYTPTPYPTLADSTGGQLNPTVPGGGTVANTGICSMCHGNNIAYARTQANPAPWIKGVYGKTGSNLLAVVFSGGVYSNAGASGALIAADFAYADADNGRTVTGVTHAAGESTASVSLSSALDSAGDLGVDTLAAATASSIFDDASLPMGTTPVTVTGDATPPTVSGPSPAPGATGIAQDANLSFALSDSQSGVGWTTFSIQLTGSLGYSRTYTGADTAVVTKSGVPTGYDVTVNPDADFSPSEVITVRVDASDLAGNAMTTEVWSFTVRTAATPVTAILHPSGLAKYSNGADINQNFTVVGTGATWENALDSDDQNTTRVDKCCDGTPSYPYNHLFAVDMDDLSAIGGSGAPGSNPTIVSLTFHVRARYCTLGGPEPKTNTADQLRIGYRIDTNTPPPSTEPVWDSYFTTPAGGSAYSLVSSATYTSGLTLSNIDNLLVFVQWRAGSGYSLRTTEIYAEVVYIPGN